MNDILEKQRINGLGFILDDSIYEERDFKELYKIYYLFKAFFVSPAKGWILDV